MLVAPIVLLSTVVSISNAFLRSERFDNECSKPLANFSGFKNVKEIIPMSTELNCRRNGAKQTLTRTNDYGRALSKRDDVGEGRDDISEAFNLYDWWQNLKNNRSNKVVKQDPICNSVKMVCFDEMMNAQLFNKSYMPPFHYKPRFIEPFGNMETNNYLPWPTAKLTDHQMVDSIKDVVDSKTEDNTAGEMTTIQDFSEPMESTTIGTHFLTGTTVEIPISRERKKFKKKNENNSRKNLNDSNQRLTLKLKENRKASRDSKTPNPLGNFTMEILENVGSVPTPGIDESTSVNLCRNKNRLETLKPSSQIDMNLDEKNDSTVTVKCEDGGRVRVARSLYPNPTDTRQFHLMHGLYSANGAQMEEALRKAQIQAINVAYELEHSDRFRQPQSDLFGSNYKTDRQQIVPDSPDEIIPADRNERNRNFKRKINQNPYDISSIFDKQLRDRMRFLDDLNLEILKKKEELDLLSRTCRNNQFLWNTDRFQANTNKADQFIKPQLKYVNEATDSSSDAGSLQLLNDISLPRNINNIPIPSSANNLSSYLINDPSFDAIIKAYANNYLPPLLPKKNTSDYSLRKKREIHEDGLEGIAGPKNGYYNTSPLQNLSKEEFINSLKELEELQKLLLKQYDRVYGSCNRRNGKRWLIPKKESENFETTAPKPQFENSNVYVKNKTVNVVQPAHFITHKRHDISEPMDYYKKFTVLEKDLLDLKNSLASFNCEQVKVDNPNNDTNNIYVQVNVSVALFNGSSTPPGCDRLVGRMKECPLVDDEPTKDKKMNLTESLRKNKKIQVSRIKQWKPLDKKRDLNFAEKQNIVDNKFSCCRFNTQNLPNINSNICPSESFKRNEAIRNLNRQFDAIEKVLLEDTKNICESNKRDVSLKNLKYCNTKRRSVGEYLDKSSNDRILEIKKFRPCNDYHMKNDKCKSDRSYRDREFDGNIMNYRCRKQRDRSFQLEANRNSYCNNIPNLARLNNKTNTINCKKKTGLLHGKLIEPSPIRRSNDAESGFTETIETRIVKPGIKNFTIILNRKRKNCEFNGGSKRFSTKYINLNLCPDNISDDYFEKNKRNMSDASTDTDRKYVSKRRSSKFINKFWKTPGENGSWKKLIEIKNPRDENVRRNELNDRFERGKQYDRGLIENLKNGDICNFAETNSYSDDFNIRVDNFSKVDTAKNTWRNLLERNSNSREKKVFIARTNLTKPDYSGRDKRSVVNESYPKVIKNLSIPLHVFVSDGEGIGDAVKRFVKSQFEKLLESSSYARDKSKRHKPYSQCIYNLNGSQQRFYTGDDPGGYHLDFLNPSITIEQRGNGVRKDRSARNTTSPTTVIIDFANYGSNADEISTTECKGFETNTLFPLEQTSAIGNRKTNAFVIDMAGFEDETSAVTNDYRDISGNSYGRSGKMNTLKYNMMDNIKYKSFLNPKDEYSGELLNSFDVTLYANKPDNIDSKKEVIENNKRLTWKDVNPRENEKKPDRYSQEGTRGKLKSIFKKSAACRKCFRNNVSDPNIKDYRYFSLNNVVKDTRPRGLKQRETYKKSGRTSLNSGIEIGYGDFFLIQTENINSLDELNENKSERDFIKTTCAYFEDDDREQDHSMGKENERGDDGLYFGKSGWDEFKEEDADSYTIRPASAILPTGGAITRHRKEQLMKRLLHRPHQRGRYRSRDQVHRYKDAPFSCRRSFLRPATVTDTIYISKYSVKIGRRYRTEPPFDKLKSEIDELNRISDCTRKFRKSVAKFRESLRRDRMITLNDNLMSKGRRGRKKARKHNEEDRFTDRRQLWRYPREKNQIDSSIIEQITDSP